MQVTKIQRFVRISIMDALFVLLLSAFILKYWVLKMV